MEKYHEAHRDDKHRRLRRIPTRWTANFRQTFHFLDVGRARLAGMPSGEYDSIRGPEMVENKFEK